MAKTEIIIAGIRGKLGRDVALAVQSEPGMDLFPWGIGKRESKGEELPPYVDLAMPNGGIRRTGIITIAEAKEFLAPYIGKRNLIVVDATKPSEVESNSALYDPLGLNYLMLTTGGTLTTPKKVIGVPLPNTARPIARLNAMLDIYSQEHQGELEGCVVNVEESHQKTKPDFSGTANKVLPYFQIMGATIGIKEKRRTEEQYAGWDIPQQHWKRHGWHKWEITSGKECRGLIKLTRNISDFFHSDESLSDYEEIVKLSDKENGYSRISKSGNARFELETAIPNPHLLRFGTFINGGEIYGKGAVFALRSLKDLIASGAAPGIHSIKI